MYICSIMKYVVRAVKYFLYITVIVAIFLAVLVMLGLVSPDVDKMFRNGYDSLWQIGLVFGVISALYPRFGFSSRGARILGPYQDIRDGVVSFMEDHGYRLESEKDENLSFRMRSPIMRTTRMFEDRVTMTRDIHGFVLEGPSKDITRLVYGLESRFAATDNME